jgi:hypothetical protein
MKKLICLFLILFSFISFAQDLNELTSFFDVPSSANVNPAEFQINTSLSKLESQFNSYMSESGSLKIKVEKVTHLPNEAMAQIKPVLSNSDQYIRIMVTEDAMSNRFIHTQIEEYLRAINGAQWSNSQSWLEAYTNARAGSKQAMVALAESKVKLSYYTYGNDNFKEIYQSHVVPDLEQKYAVLNKDARADISARKKQFETRKIIFNELDKAEGQLKDLIAKNDRKAVARLVETYIPWELMEPSEKLFWKEWIEVMENPAPLEKRMFVLRGLDQGQHFLDAGGKPYVMSPILINNQGTYNRRLRSMTTMLDKQFSQSVALSYADDPAWIKKMSTANRLTVQMKQHSRDPMGSAFISFTKDPNIAQAFSYNHVGLFAIDPRQAIPNHMSGYEEEVEILARMFLFPDESIGLMKSSEDIPKQVKTLLKEQFGEAKAEQLYKQEFVDHKLVKKKSFYQEAHKMHFQFMDAVSAVNCNSHLSP